MMDFLTVGVYGLNESQFFNKLTDNGIDTFCDIRQRRAVRGAKYSFVNSARLQLELEKIGISYIYFKELAPTKEIRSIQKNDDILQNVKKIDRRLLSTNFVSDYTNIILNQFNFSNFFRQLNSIGAKKVALFCVEATHLACHRSILANKLEIDYGCDITHL